MPTAAVIIIGNEILSGKFADENGPFFIGRLRELGVDLKRIVTVPDEHEAIAAEVRFCSSQFDHVFTSGGVGPTHDDITFESIARGFEVPLVRSQSMVDLLAGAGLTGAHALRMATVPEGTELLREVNTSYPVLRCRNVYILPGVPRLLRAKFELIAHHFHGDPIFVGQLYTSERETAIAARLQDVQDRFESVDIGSYPRFEDGHWYVLITLESRDEERLDQARTALEEVLTLIAPPVS